MFFHIGPSKLGNFPVHYQHSNLHINLDSGWHQARDHHGNLLLYKGYLDDYKIDTKLEEIAAQEEPIFRGNFCLFKLFDQGISVKSDRARSFPIWYDRADGINNLIPKDYTVWTDSYIMLLDNFKLVESKFDAIGQVACIEQSLDTVLDKVDQLLTQKIHEFFDNNKLPVNVFLSGGIDTMLLYSYIKRLGITHTLINFNHIDYDYFYLNNHDSLEKFWGYRQIHHWREACILVSGAPGDEFTARSPTTANMLLKYHGASIPELLRHDWSAQSLHYTYFNNPKYFKIWEEQAHLSYTSLEHVIRQCASINLNDWQHWHLGETLTYTPLRDIEIFKTIASLNKDDLIAQVMDSLIQKRLIEKNAPELLLGLSIQKNSNNCMANLTKLL